MYRTQAAAEILNNSYLQQECDRNFHEKQGARAYSPRSPVLSFRFFIYFILCGFFKSFRRFISMTAGNEHSRATKKVQSI
jgi:hypothetical protein